VPPRLLAKILGKLSSAAHSLRLGVFTLQPVFGSHLLGQLDEQPLTHGCSGNAEFFACLPQASRIWKSF
jgi:hypothetical protein